MNIVLSFDNAGQLPKQCQDKFVEVNACQVIFRMNYLMKEIHLDFSGGDDPKRNYQLNLSVLNKFDEPKYVNGNITYTCKTENNCAQLFYQSTVSKLIQNEPILNEIRAGLYDPMAGNIEQCSNNSNQPITCENGYGCHGYEIIENGKRDYEGECRNASTLTIFPRLYFSITLVQGASSLSSDWNHLGYTCNKQNLCNTREQINMMVKLANDFYPWEYFSVNSSAKLYITFHYLLAIILAVHSFCI